MLFFSVNTCGLAVLSTCTIAGHCFFANLVQFVVIVINRIAYFSEFLNLKYLLTFTSLMTGANGINSVLLSFLFKPSLILFCVADANIVLLHNALGPNSPLP